jgi:hypothetical protein
MPSFIFSVTNQNAQNTSGIFKEARGRRFAWAVSVARQAEKGISVENGRREEDRRIA